MPGTPAPTPDEPLLKRPRGWRLVGHLVGYALSIAVLVWVIRSILGKPDMLEKLPKLRDTPLWMIVALLACSAGTIVLSSLIFWAVLRPIRRLGILDLIAVNSAATLLGVLPFKLNFVYRVLTHIRRDGMALLEVTSWMIATAIIILVSLAGVILASFWRSELDAWWWLTATGVPTLAGAGMLVFGRRLLRLRVLDRYRQRPWMLNLVNGVLMLSNERCLTFALAMRFMDIACHTLRFYLAGEAARLAGIVGTGLTLDQSVLAGSVFFLTQIISPTGMLGPREGATLALLNFTNGPEFGIIVLVVSLAESVVDIVMGLLGLWWLRPDRYLFGNWKAHSAARLAELAKKPPPPEYPLGDAPSFGSDQPDRRRS